MKSNSKCWGEEEGETIRTHTKSTNKPASQATLHLTVQLENSGKTAEDVEVITDIYTVKSQTHGLGDMVKLATRIVAP